MIRTRLTALILLLLALVLFLVGALAWSVWRAQDRIDRSRIANEELNAYVAVSEAAYRHFKNLADLIITKVPEDARDLVGTERLLRQRLQELQALTKDEIINVIGRDERPEELDEIEMVGNIARTVDSILAQFQDLRQHRDEGDDEALLRRLFEITGTSIDGTFRSLLRAAIRAEAEEVRRADLEARELLTQLVWIALATTTCIVALGLGAVAFLVRRVRKPMDALIEGARRLSEGHLEHRIGLAGSDEFARLGEAVDDMAARLQAQHDELLHARTGLEQIVKERTEALGEANDKLKRTDELRQRFLADISHELRTPLTVIRGEADVALRGKDKSAAEYKDSLRLVVDQASQLARLVNDLLMVARAKGGAMRLDLGAVALRGLIEEACGHAARLGAAVRIVLAAGADEAVALGDRDRLMQLFMILLDNAARYSAPGGKVVVDVRNEGQVARVTVADTGAGMSPVDRENAFERFYRGSEARKLAPDGSGLGLPLAKAIAEAHDGAVRIDSVEGEGTIVTVTLPLAAPLRASA